LNYYHVEKKIIISISRNILKKKKFFKHYLKLAFWIKSVGGIVFKILKNYNNIVDVGDGNDDIPALATVAVATSGCDFLRFKEVEEIIDGFCLIF
jgi:hypothetical protein